MTDTTKKLEETLEQIVRMRHDPEFVRRAAKTALAWLSSAAPATEGERKAFESDLDELLRLAQSVSGWHAEYMGKVMPDRIYESFARQRDEQIPALRRKLIDVLVSKASAPDCGWSECPHGAECVHAKASAPEPVALTDEQIDALDTGVLHVMAPRGRESVREFARRIAALAASPSDDDLGRRLYAAEGTANRLAQELESARGCISDWVTYAAKIADALGLEAIRPEQHLHEIARLRAASLSAPVSDDERRALIVGVVRRGPSGGVGVEYLPPLYSLAPGTELVAASVEAQAVPSSTEQLRALLEEVNKTDNARWEVGFRNIVAILHGPRHRFEIKDVVEDVRSQRERLKLLRRFVDSIPRLEDDEVNSRAAEVMDADDRAAAPTPSKGEA